MKRTTTLLIVFLAISTFLTGFVVAGKATITYYAKRYNGRLTANGERYSDAKLTCATSKRSYLGKHIEFRNGKNKVIVWCNDLMAKDSILRFDLTTRAFKTLNDGSTKRGVMHLLYRVVDGDYACAIK